MDFVSQFKGLRKMHKKSISVISKLSGVHVNTITNWEYAGVEPTLKNFDTALNAMGYELKICKKEIDTKDKPRSIETI